MATPPDVEAGGSPPSPTSDQRARTARESLVDAPPFLTWRAIYSIVVGALALQVVIYTTLSRVFR